MSKITTIWTYQLNNVQTEFAVNFDYLSRKFVQVTLIGKDRKVLRMNVDYRFIGPKTIKTNKPWGSNDGYQYLEIRRVTSATDSIVDFSDGSILRAGDLTIANLQSMHIAEEARNLAGDALGVNDDGQLDARARRIVNLGNPVGRLDAVNKAYVDDAEDGAVQARDKALQYRNEAEGFRNEALSAKTTVESKIGYLDAKYERAEQLNTEANKNSSKALEAVAGAQRSAQEAASSASNAKASEKNAKTSEDKAREFATSIDPDTLVKKSMIAQTTGEDVSLVVSQDLMTKEVNKLMPKTGGEFSDIISIKRPNEYSELHLYGGSDTRCIIGNTPDGVGRLVTRFGNDTKKDKIIQIPHMSGKMGVVTRAWFTVHSGNFTGDKTINLGFDSTGMDLEVGIYDTQGRYTFSSIPDLIGSTPVLFEYLQYNGKEHRVQVKRPNKTQLTISMIGWTCGKVIVKATDA